MILENDLIRLTTDPARGATISGLLDKTTGRDYAIAPGMAALLHDRSFDVNDRTLSAISSDGALRLSKLFTLVTGERAVEISITIENLTAVERDVLWGERFAFNAQTLGPSCRVLAPIVSYFDPKEEPVLRMRWPNLVDGTDLSSARCITPGETRTFFLSDFAEGTCSLAAAASGSEIVLSWDVHQFSYCWLEETSGGIALAPFTGMPDAVNEGHGTLTLPPNGSVSTRFVIRIK